MRCWCVCPRPLTRNREPDLGPLVDSTRALAEVLQAGQLVCSSPRPTGHDQGARRAVAEESGLQAGRDFHLAFSPERVDPGRTDSRAQHPEGGGWMTQACAERAEAIYGLVCEQLVRVSA